MTITIPRIDIIWEEDDPEVKERMTEVLRDLFYWADKHAVTLYFDERPDVLPYSSADDEMGYHDWGDKKWNQWGRWVRDCADAPW
jgi:hypothetical protein